MIAAGIREWLHAQEPALRAIARPDRYPVVTRYLSQERDFSLDELFEFGLRRMLDGLTAPDRPSGSARSG